MTKQERIDMIRLKIKLFEIDFDYYSCFNCIKSKSQTCCKDEIELLYYVIDSLGNYYYIIEKFNFTSTENLCFCACDDFMFNESYRGSLIKF